MKYPRLLLDPEFGPLIFRRWNEGGHCLVLILREKIENETLWCLVIDNGPLKTQGKESEARWMHSSHFNRLKRVARNELFLECGLVGI